jgi:hypothetical protein
MHLRLLLLLPLLLPGFSCNRDDGDAIKRSKSERVVAKGDSRPADARAPQSGRSTEPAAPASARELAEAIYQCRDRELLLLFESIRFEAESDEKGKLYATMYEETLIRPEFIRLPLILEMARQPELDPTLKSTIMAELGTKLSTNHGNSWGDWALALDEHLAATEGFLRVE